MTEECFIKFVAPYKDSKWKDKAEIRYMEGVCDQAESR